MCLGIILKHIFLFLPKRVSRPILFSAKRKQTTMSIAKTELTVSLADMTDEKLMRLYQRSGEPKYLGQLYKRYAHLILGVCLKYFKNKEDARDMVMEIFEALMHKSHQIEADSINNWFYVFARNQCVSTLRKRKSIANQQKDFINSEKSSEIFMENDSSLRLNSKREKEHTAYDIAQAVEKLNVSQRTCVKLFFLEQKKYQQIAEKTGYTLNEVKSHLQNGKRNLKILLQQ